MSKVSKPDQVNFVTLTKSGLRQVRIMYVPDKVGFKVYVVGVDIGNIFGIIPRSMHYYIKRYCKDIIKCGVPSPSGYQNTTLISNKEVSKLIDIFAKDPITILKDDDGKIDDDRVTWLQTYNVANVKRKVLDPFIRDPFSKYKTEFEQAKLATKAMISDSDWEKLYLDSLAGTYLDCQRDILLNANNVSQEFKNRELFYFKELNLVVYKSKYSNFEDREYEVFIKDMFSDVNPVTGVRNVVDVVKIPRIVTKDYIESLMIGSLFQRLYKEY